MPYLFPPGEDAANLVRQLGRQNWRGQIIGPHGSGKSTLLASLAAQLAQAGREPLTITLHDNEPTLARHSDTLNRAQADTIVIIDGFEQLSTWSRWRVRRFCRRRGAGLLVTAHASVGLKTLAVTAVDARTAAAVFHWLVPDAVRLSEADLAAALAAHPTNLRDVLDALYDLYELRRWECATISSSSR